MSPFKKFSIPLPILGFFPVVPYRLPCNYQLALPPDQLRFTLMHATEADSVLLRANTDLAVQSATPEGIALHPNLGPALSWCAWLYGLQLPTSLQE